MNEINELKLSLLRLDFKLQFIKRSSYVKFRELDDELCLTIIIYSFSEWLPKYRTYLKKTY